MLEREPQVVPKNFAFVAALLQAQASRSKVQLTLSEAPESMLELAFLVLVSRSNHEQVALEPIEVVEPIGVAVPIEVEVSNELAASIEVVVQSLSERLQQAVS